MSGETTAGPTAYHQQNRRPQPRERLLEAASALFYAEGVRSVGVDRLIAEAQVTKATFHRHFPTKDDLVIAYPRGRDEGVRTRLSGAATAVAGDPGGTLGLPLDGLDGDSARRSLAQAAGAVGGGMLQGLSDTFRRDP